MQLGVGYTGMPSGYVPTSKLPTKVDVEVRDVGFSLLYLRHLSGCPDSIYIDVSESWDSAKQVVSIDNKTLHDAVSKRMAGAANLSIEQFYPSDITVTFARLYRKVVPVVLTNDIVLSRQFTYRSPIEIYPRTVTLYGEKSQLEAIVEIPTFPLSLVDLQNDWSGKVKLQEISGVKMSTDQVDVALKVEPFTEERLSVDVQALNVPSGRVLRTFPAKVDVVFNVGLSHYNQVDTSDFVVTADCQQIDKTQSGSRPQKLKLQVKSDVSFISNLRSEPDRVEYLLNE